MPFALLTRIRAEYLEMPGLRLTIPQAQRLCGVEGAACKTALDALVAERFLCLKPDGSYANKQMDRAVHIREGSAQS